MSLIAADATPQHGMEFPYFLAERACPKCGASDARTVFVERHGYYPANQTCPLAGHRLILDLDLHGWEPEHIHRTCVRCGFGWIESPINAPLIIIPSESQA